MENRWMQATRSASKRWPTTSTPSATASTSIAAMSSAGAMGISALLLALRHPEKIRKMVVSGPNLWPDTTGVVPYIFHLMERTADSLHHKGSLTAAEKNLLKTTELDLYQPHITLEQLHAIKCPTMVVGGDHDAIPSLHLWQMAQNIPQSYLWIVPNSGHSVVIYKKAQFNPLVNDFFRKPYRRIEGMDVMK